jgi:hypothetical protein
VRSTQVDQAGRGQAGGVALLAHDDDDTVGIAGFGQPVRAVGVEPPLEVVALNDQCTRDLTELGPLCRRADVDQQTAVTQDLPGLVRIDPGEELSGLRQQPIDSAQGAHAGSARYSARSTTSPGPSWRKKVIEAMGGE